VLGAGLTSLAAMVRSASNTPLYELCGCWILTLAWSKGWPTSTPAPPLTAPAKEALPKADLRDLHLTGRASPRPNQAHTVLAALGFETERARVEGRAETSKGGSGKLGTRGAAPTCHKVGHRSPCFSSAGVVVCHFSAGLGQPLCPSTHGVPEVRPIAGATNNGHGGGARGRGVG